MKLGKQGQVWCWRFPKNGTYREKQERGWGNPPCITPVLALGMQAGKKNNQM